MIGDLAGLAPGVVAEAVGGIGVTVAMGIFLSPAMMSVYTLYWLAQSYAQDIVAGWLRHSIIRYMPAEPGHLRRFAKGGAIITMATAVLFSIAGIGLATVFPETIQPLHYYLTVLALAGGMAFHIIQSFLRALFQNLAYSRGSAVLAMMKLALAIVLSIVMDDKVAAMLGAMSVSFTIAAVMQGLLLFRNAPTPGEAPLPNGNLLMTSLRYGAPMTASMFLLNFLRTGDRYLLAGFVNLDELGAYAYWVATGFQAGATIQSFIFMAMNPRLFQLYERDKDAGRKFMGTFSSFYLAISIPLFVIIGFLLPPVLAFAKIRIEYFGHAWLVFFGLYQAFIMGLAQIHGKNNEFEGTTGVYVTASGVGITAMAVAVLALAWRVGVLGGALGVALGFTVFFAVVAGKSRSWPSIRDVAIGFAGGLVTAALCLALRSLF